MPAFEKTDALDEIIAQAIEQFYPDTLQAVGLTVDVLFHESEDGLMFHGRPAYAYVKPQGAREKANGANDVLMVVDRRAWEGLTPERQLALVDHELHHIQPKKAKDGSWKMDDHGRPRLKTKAHDIEVGWFLQVAERHGQNAIEVTQAQDMLEKHKKILFQLELPLGDRTAHVRQAPANVVQMNREETPLEREERLDREETAAAEGAKKPKAAKAPRGSTKKAAAKA
jgi:hypothetical protein